MTRIPGTNVASGIVPFTTEDEFPTHYSEYGKGGWREVATIAERDSITSTRRKLGMAVYVQETDKVYILKRGISNEYWVPMSDSGSGGGNTFVFSQSAASATWIIEHNLEKYPSVTVVTSAGTVVVGDVIYNNENIVTITFNGAFKGKAYLN